MRVIDEQGAPVPYAELHGRMLEIPDAYTREVGAEAMGLYVARRLATCDANGVAELALGSPISIFASDSTGTSEAQLLEAGRGELDYVCDCDRPVVRVGPQAHLSVRAVDARTDDPIQTFVTWMELIRRSGERAGNHDNIRRESHEGSFRITHGLLRELPIRLWVHAPGYVAQVVDLTEVGTDPPDEVTVRLEPTSAKTLYLLVAPDDRPHSGRFLPRDPLSGRRLFHAENRAGGVTLDGWDGGEVELRIVEVDGALEGFEAGRECEGVFVRVERPVRA